jgi:hypothetical protein
MIKMLTLSLMTATSLMAATFSGEGYAPNREDAINSARSELSNNLISEVKSLFTSNATSKGDKFSQNSIRVYSQLPLIGATVEEFPSRDGIRVVATLTSDKSLDLYKQKIRDTKKEFQAALRIAKSDALKANRLSAYEKLLKLSDEYKRLNNVAILLGAPSSEALELSEADITNEIKKLTDQIDSIDEAVTALSKEINFSNIYVRNASANYSSIPTPFAMALRDKLSTSLKGINDEKKASIIAEGRYVINASSIDITYTYIDPIKGEVLGAKNVSLPLALAKGYDYAPKELAFEEAINNGLIVSSDFKVSLSTNKGSRDLSFKKGDTVEPLVKLSRMGSFYVVGHTKTNAGTYSYLLQLNYNVGGDAQFIRTIAPEEINRVFSLGEFEVSEPFGLESLQLIAYTGKALLLPKYHLDSKTGLHVLGNDLTTNVTKTRALVKKQPADAKAEATIVYVTTK